MQLESSSELFHEIWAKNSNKWRSYDIFTVPMSCMADHALNYLHIQDKRNWLISTLEWNPKPGTYVKEIKNADKIGVS